MKEVEKGLENMCNFLNMLIGDKNKNKQTNKQPGTI